MVKYAEWVSVVWKEARSQGLDDVTFEDSQSVTTVAADIWNDRKDDIKNADTATARQIAGDEVRIE